MHRKISLLSLFVFSVCLPLSAQQHNGPAVEVKVEDLEATPLGINLTLEHNGEVQVYDARPSDAMAIGLRYDAKIFVNQEVFDQHKRQEEKPEELLPSERKTRKL